MELPGEVDAVIRPATPLDAQKIVAVKIAGWTTTYADLLPVAVLAEMTEANRQNAAVADALQQSDNVVLVADCAGQLVGIAICVLSEVVGPYLDSIHVLPGRRGHGIGRRLLAALVMELERRGHTSLELRVIAGNVRTMELYERLGARVHWRGPAEWAEEVMEIGYRWDTLPSLRDE